MFVLFVYLQGKVGYTADIVKVDVLIIGSGPIGSVYARSLQPILNDSTKKILMIDAGAQKSAKPGEHLRNQYVYQKNPSEFTSALNASLHPVAFNEKDQDAETSLVGEAVTYAVGGMSTIWTGNIPRLHAFEREGMEYIPENEWDELYTEAERLFKKNDTLFDDSIRHQTVKGVLQSFLPDAGISGLPIAATRRHDDPELLNYTGAHTILKPLLENNFASSFQLWPEHVAKKLIEGTVDDTKNNQKNIEYVIVNDLKNIGREKHIYAKIIIVASGAIMTPQLLWNSGIRPEALGRYVTEHQIAFTQVVLKNEIIDTMRKGNNEGNSLIPIPPRDPPPMVWIPASKERPWHCQVHKDSYNYAPLPPGVDDRLVVDQRWFTGIEPAATNLLTFKEDEKDFFGMPRPCFHCEPSNTDKVRMAEMMADMKEVARVLGDTLQGSEPIFRPLGACLHIQGTTRMGAANDGKSVVNPHGEVWGYSNLVIAGNSVIPTFNCGNPTLTSAALALRSSEKILNVLNKF